MQEQILNTGGPKVACIISNELLVFEYGIAYEIFGLPRPAFGSDWYQFETCTHTPGKVKISGGFEITILNGLEILESADLIIIPGWPDTNALISENLINALKAASQRGAQIAALCSGVIVLAQTGLLDGKKATTHWRVISSIAKHFPNIEFDSTVLYMDQGNVLTSAGSTAGIDLCLHLVRQKYGVEYANIVAHDLVMPPHREGGQSQSIPQPVPLQYEASRMGAVLEKIRLNLSQELPVKKLAEEAGMSLRTFQRRFEAITGLPPSAWILQARLQLACRLIEMNGHVDFEYVASKSGFGSVPTMRHHFRNKLKINPSHYKKIFSSPPHNNN